MSDEQGLPFQKLENFTLRKNFEVPDMKSLMSKRSKMRKIEFAECIWVIELITECSERTRNVPCLGVYLHCAPIRRFAHNWWCDVSYRVKFPDVKTQKVIKEIKASYNEKRKVIGCCDLVEWNDLLKYSNNNVLNFDICLDFHKVAGFIVRPQGPLPFLEPSEKSNAILLVEGRKFYVNKEFLSYHSPFFEALFFGCFSESKQDQIELQDVDADAFCELLATIYPTLKPLSDEHICEVLHLADKYCMTRLIGECEDYLLLEQCQFSILKRLSISDSYELPYLRKCCLSYLYDTKELKTVKSDPDYRLLHDRIRAELNELAEKLEQEPPVVVATKDDDEAEKTEDDLSDA